MRRPFCQDRAHKARGAVAFRVGGGGLHANRIDIAGMNFTFEVFGRRDGEDAGAGAKIEDGAWPPLACHAFQHPQAALRRAMMTGAKSERGLDLDSDVVDLDRAASMRAMHEEAPRSHRF